MSSENQVKHSSSVMTQNENYWRQSVTTTAESFSGDVAQRNLDRLKGLQHKLNHQLTSLEVRRQQVMDKAVEYGIVTDHMRDGVCEQLVSEGWLERAEPLPRAHVRPTNPLYLLTEAGSQAWDPPHAEEAETDEPLS